MAATEVLWVVGSRVKARRPGPGREAPLRADLAKRYGKDRAGLGDRLALQGEPHGGGNHDIHGVAGDIDMAWLIESDVLTRRPEVLAFGEHGAVPVLCGDWALPDMRRHAVQNLHRV